MESSQVRSNPVITNFLDPKEENISDKDFDIFYLLFCVQNLSGLKDKISKNYRVRGDVFNFIKSSLAYYCLAQVINHLEFVEWCAMHYSNY